MTSFTQVVEAVGILIDGFGVLVIFIGVVAASYRYLRVGRVSVDGFARYRLDLGQGILLGLEILIAADIIRTVAVEPTLKGVSLLGMIVLIRTFLSAALQVELEGRWPWQSQKQ